VKPKPPAPPLPLGRLRVLDLSSVLAGPWCTMTLSDLGAEVIKVENPAGGDATRGWLPPGAGGESAYYLCANRGKKSIAVDLKSQDGRHIIRRLASVSDVVVENFRFGALDALGLGYGDLKQINRKLIYCSISGYGRQSPVAERAGYDFILQAEGGLMSITGEPDGAPMKTGVAIVDLFAGMIATQAILAALLARRRTGRGQHVDVALMDAQIAMLANVGAAYLVSGKAPQRYGNAHANVAPYQSFAASDGAIVVAIGSDPQFRRLCIDVLDEPDWASDPRFEMNENRVVNRQALIGLLEAKFAKQPRGHWIARMRACGLPAGEIRTIPEALGSEEVLQRDMIRKVDHPTAGEISLIGSPLKLSDTPVRAVSAPPLLGQHTLEILEKLLGLERAEIDRLIVAQAVRGS